MREAKQLLDLPVISVDSGKQLGLVDELLFEPGRHVLFGLVLKREGDERRFLLQREQIKAVGKDAVTVEDESRLEVFDANEEARRIGALTHGGHLLEMKVLNEGGDVLGKVDKVMLEDDLTVSSYHASKGFLGLGSKQDIKPDEIVSAGEDAIVVRGEAAGR